MTIGRMVGLPEVKAKLTNYRGPGKLAIRAALMLQESAIRGLPQSPPGSRPSGLRRGTQEKLWQQ